MMGRILLAWLMLLAPVAVHADTRWDIVKRYPHDPKAFTEGLFWLDGHLWESTGQPGRSDIREVELASGKVLRSVRLPRQYFGEGIVNWRGEIISLTWQHHIGWRWTMNDLRQGESFSYTGEGWGLTQNGHDIIMSDGTDELRFLDPATMAERRRISVTWRDAPVRNLNELEYVRGEILANVWMTDQIARIDPKSGKVIDWIDLTALSRRVNLTDPDAVLNGIAYDAARDRLFVTGKYWPSLFEIRLRR